MTEAILALSVVQLVLLWQIRRAVGLRVKPRIPLVQKTSYRRADFRGALPPNRFAVVRWPDGLHLYQGCVGAKAREVYDQHHPAQGEEIELWELGDCRGSK